MSTYYVDHLLKISFGLNTQTMKSEIDPRNPFCLLSDDLIFHKRTLLRFLIFSVLQTHFLSLKRCTFGQFRHCNFFRIENFRENIPFPGSVIFLVKRSFKLENSVLKKFLIHQYTKCTAVPLRLLLNLSNI